MLVLSKAPQRSTRMRILLHLHLMQNLRGAEHPFNPTANRTHPNALDRSRIPSIPKVPHPYQPQILHLLGSLQGLLSVSERLIRPHKGLALALAKMSRR